jgi:DNA-binding MarR family transcriptional regulator
MPNSTQLRPPTQIDYRLHTMNRDGHIIDVSAFEAAGDLAAMVAADSGDGKLRELWCGDRRVAEFPNAKANNDGNLDLVDAAVPRASEPAAQTSALTLEFVRRVQKARADRSAFLPAELFADPAWDMLLELYAGELEQKRLSLGSLSPASGVPPTTASRWIRSLEDHDLTCREDDWRDGRRSWISLSSLGSAAMQRYFTNVSSEGGPFPRSSVAGTLEPGPKGAGTDA